MQSCVGVPLKDQHLHTSNSQYLQMRASPFFQKTKGGRCARKIIDAPNKNRGPTAAVCCDGWTKPAADEWNIYRIKWGRWRTMDERESSGVDILSIAFCRAPYHVDVTIDVIPWRTTPATNNFTQTPIDWSCTHYYSSTDCVMVVNLIVINVECAR